MIQSDVAEYLIACYNRQDMEWREHREETLAEGSEDFGDDGTLGKEGTAAYWSVAV